MQFTAGIIFEKKIDQFITSCNDVQTMYKAKTAKSFKLNSNYPYKTVYTKLFIIITAELKFAVIWHCIAMTFSTASQVA